jgi:hypothetical protein
MRRLVPIIFALLATASVAQSPAGQTPATFPVPPANFGCPVGFTANRQPGIGQAMSAGDQKQPGPAQGLHLTLSRPSKGDIQSIEVTVYATSTKLRALPLDSQSDDTISKTFTLTREAGASSLNEAEVWMHEVGSIRYADLIAITFTSGTTWHLTEDVRCRAVPSNFVLVTKR